MHYPPRPILFSPPSPSHPRYVTLHPCNECAKLIIQSRIAEVIFLCDAHKDDNSMAASRKMLELAGVRSRPHTPAVPRVVIDFDAVAV